MSNLLRLPPTTTMTAEQALQSALVDAESKHLDDVLIIGYDKDGDLYIRSSRINCAQAFFLAHKAARWAESGGVFMKELTFEEFCALPMLYTIGCSGDAGAHRQYFNEEYGVFRLVDTKRKRKGDIYSGWKPQVESFALVNIPGEYPNAAMCYEALMRKICGVPE